MTGIRKFAAARETAASAKPVRPAPRKAAAPAPEADPIAQAMDAAAANAPRLLTPRAVGELLELTERTLERWRITGEGPRFVKLSRSTVRYLPDDIAEFVADRLRANTSQ